MSAAASANTENCTIVSLDHPDLMYTDNKETICSDALTELSAQLGYDPSAPILLTVLGQYPNAVSVKFEFTDKDGKTVSGLGTEFWHPGDSYFKIQN
jgi:hypothetical protein